MSHRISNEIPTVDTYRRLREATGLSAKTAEAAAAGRPGSWHAVVVRCGDEPVGMGRIIGDGGLFFQIADICVLAEHRGQGLAKQIMRNLTAELERRAPATAYASLIADGEARHLYAQYGFAETTGRAVGMDRTF